MIPYTLALLTLTTFQNNSVGETLKGIVLKTLSLPPKILSATWEFVVGDAMHILKDPRHLVTNELYERSIAKGVGVGFFSRRPVMYVFSGNKRLIEQIAQYGELPQEDVHARDDFSIIETALRYKTVVNLTGKEARDERIKLKNHISGNDILHSLMLQTHDFVNEYFNNSWDESISLQNQIGYLSTNIIAKNFLGIPHVPMEYIPLIQRLSALIDEGNLKSSEFKQLVAQFREIDIQALKENQDEILGARKYISDHLQLTDEDTEETILEKLRNIPSISTLILQDNLTATINMAIAQIAKSEEIQSRLQEEIEKISDISALDPRDLCRLKYLDAIYSETLRFLSPTAIIVRKTSKSLTLPLNDEQDIIIGPQSRLFIPIRRIHHDERYWDHPEQFDPSHFLSGKKQEHFMPFSLGKRACPAGGTKYAEVLVKTFIVSIFSQYLLTINQDLEVIPKESTYPRWVNPYFAQIQSKALKYDFN